MEELHNDKISYKQLGHLGQQELHWSAESIDLTLSLVIAENEQHLIIMQIEILYDQDRVSLSKCNELRLPSLLTELKKHRNYDDL